MKTNCLIIKNSYCVFIIFFTWATWHACGQTKNLEPNDKMLLLPLVTNGNNILTYRPEANCYPYIQIKGDDKPEGSELTKYALQLQSRQIPVEILPSERDSKGNWGKPLEGMQVSARLHREKFYQNDLIPVYLILRNLDSQQKKWLRSASSDNGYQFILTFGTNIYKWQHASKKHEIPADYIMINNSLERQPYVYIVEPQAQDLTVVYVNRFFDLSRLGQYSIQAQIQVPTRDQKGTTNVISGIAKFEVIEKEDHK